MNQLDIYCFTSIARTKSFSITARELMISQQAVSNHIKTLEEEVGYTLFFRYGQTAVLTKAGEIMLDYFIQRDKLAGDFFQSHQVRDSDSPFLIAWTTWAGCPEIAETLLDGFRKEYPTSRFFVADMPAEKLKQDLLRKKIDVLFTSRYSADYLSMSWEHTFICSQEICLISSSRKPQTVKDLADLPFFTVPAGENNEHTVIERAKKTCQKMGFDPHNVYICSDIGSAYLNVITQNGLSFATDNTALPEGGNFKLTRSGVYSDYIMCSPYYSQDESVQLFTTYIKDHIKTIAHRSIKEAGQ